MTESDPSELVIFLYRSAIRKVENCGPGDYDKLRKLKQLLIKAAKDAHVPLDPEKGVRVWYDEWKMRWCFREDANMPALKWPLEESA